MDKETQSEICLIYGKIDEMTAAIRTLKRLIKVHDQAIGIMQHPLRDPARAHDPH